MGEILILLILVAWRGQLFSTSNHISLHIHWEEAMFSFQPIAEINRLNVEPYCLFSMDQRKTNGMAIAGLTTNAIRGTYTP